MGLFPAPVERKTVGRTGIEIWVKERAFPTGADAIVVPVAPNLRMTTGIAKWVRDATAGRVQYEALPSAPMQPGDVFIGCGGKYRFDYTALAVVMDEFKRTSAEWISTAVANALRECAAKGATSVLLPDMTEDLLRQPAWITDEQRHETCEPIARAMLAGIEAADGAVREVKIWVWRKTNADIWKSVLK